MGIGTNGAALGNRIDEIMLELNNCREDERNSQSQIIQVIVAAGTILGILFGASFFNTSSYAKITFRLSICVFCTAFAYIMTLGTGNVLRYHYIQDLEDRLHKLIPDTQADSTGRPFIHWSCFFGPIVTRNFHHVSSAYTLLLFLNYSIATLMAVVFSISLIVFQYLKIEPGRFDYFLAFAAIVLMSAIFVFFAITSILAKKMAAFAWRTGANNLKCRVEGDPSGIYCEAKEFRRISLYFLYPKYRDIQKPGLICLGFLAGMIFTTQETGSVNLLVCLGHLLYVLFCFDFLAYQARFQFNDIRGVTERKNPLKNASGNISPEYIQLSLFIIFIRIILAIAGTFFANKITGNKSIALALTFSLSFLLLLTVGYETARTKKSKGWIYFLVGGGYPLRFFLGLFAATPQMYWTELLHSPQLILGVVAFWVYGMYSAIMAWANEVVKISNDTKEGETPSYDKDHYSSLHDILEDHYYSYNENTKKVFSLQERGKLCDIWNILYGVAMFCLCVSGGFLAPVPSFVLRIEVLAMVYFLAAIFARGKMIRNLSYMGVFLAVGNIFFVAGKMSFSWCYVFLYLIQILFGLTYKVLRYPCEANKKVKEYLNNVVKGIIGKDALGILKPKTPK